MENQKTIMFMISGFGDVSMSPKTNFPTLETPGHSIGDSKQFKKRARAIAGKCYFGKVTSRNSMFLKFLKRRGPRNPEDLSKHFEKLEYGINIFSNHEMEIRY